MYNSGAERSAGWSGLAFIVLLIVSILLFGAQPPDIGASSATVSVFLMAHAKGLLLSCWLGFPLAAFFLWFAAGLRANLRQAAGSPDGLPLYGITAAIIVVMLSLLASAIMSALILAPAGAGDQGTFWAIYWLLGTPFISMGLAIFIFACAHSMRRHGSAPEWLALYGYLTAFGSAVSTLSMFYTSGPMAPNGWVPLVLGPPLFVIWMIAVSIRLIRTPGVSRPA